MSVRSVVGYVIAFSFIALVTFAAGVQPAALTPVAFILTGGSWLSFIVLGRAALRKPRIGALTERAFIAFVIAALGTISCAIVLNTDSGHAYFPTEVASLMFRLGIIAVLAVPSLWLVLWLTGRLGQDEAHSVVMYRIEDAIAENTRISQEASDHADAAYHEANNVNERISAQDRRIASQNEAQTTATEHIGETVEHTAEQVDDIHKTVTHDEAQP